jgi:rRNA maturation RNase YbeY
MASKSKVYFFFDKVSTTLRGRKKLKRDIELLFEKEKKALIKLNFIFCNDKTLLNINRQYLKHDYYTDIITFDLSENSKKISGEIYISLDRVRDNAEKLGVSLPSELHRVVLHGALHLCGYKDKTRHERKNMRKKEEYYMGQFFR